MSNPLVRAPRLPNPTPIYDQQYMEALIRSLRLYFNQLDNPGSVLASTQNITTAANDLAHVFCIQSNTCLYVMVSISTLTLSIALAISCFAVQR